MKQQKVRSEEEKVRSDNAEGDTDSKVEDCLNKWEKSGGLIFSKNAHRATLDILKFPESFGINPQLIIEAVVHRVKQRCLECGSDDAPNESKDEGRRCKSCHDIYSNPPSVKVPEEISLEPVEVIE